MTHQLWTTLIRYQISPNQLYYLDCLRLKIEPQKIIDAHSCKLGLMAAGYIDRDGKLSEGAQQILNEFEMLLVKTKRKVSSEVMGEKYTAKIKEFLSFFPAKRLSSGVVAQSTVQDMIPRMIWFFKTYPEYDWDTVLDAAQYYCILKEREHFQWMMNSAYFVQKVDPTTKISRSELATYCQLITADPDLLANVNSIV